MEFIKITYDDGEVWRAKFHEKRGSYVSESVGLIVDKDGSRNGLVVDEIVYQTWEELQLDKSIKAEEIVESEYLYHTQLKLLDSINGEVYRYKRKLKEAKDKMNKEYRHLLELEQKMKMENISKIK